MISFIIPVYNKGTILFKTLSSLISQLAAKRMKNYEIIIVSDGSTDNSFAEAVRFKTLNGKTDKIKIFHYHNNIGKGFALRFGFYKSVGDTVVFLDGDMDIDTTQVLTALKAFSAKKPDMIVASKYMAGSRGHYPWNRYVYSLILKFTIQSLFSLSVSDTQVGLKVFRRDVLTRIFPRLIIKRFAVDLELLVVAQMLGFTNIVEMPVIINHTSANQSTVNIWAAKNFCQDIAAIFYRKNILHYYDQSVLDGKNPAFAFITA
jgi:glycosyltransferase involved in cell wall biosynthesis